MKPVTVDEIIEELIGLARHAGYTSSELADRIQAHGIAPPEGMVLVPIITEATPFNCGINGDPPQVDHAWTPPCKIWCGRKQCAAKEN